MPFGGFQNGVYDQLRSPLMQMVKIHIPSQVTREDAILAVMRRGRVICIVGDIFVVPEPALDVLRSFGVTFQELGRGGIDYAEKALRDSLAPSA